MKEEEQACQWPFFPWVGHENDCDHPFQKRTIRHNYHQGSDASLCTVSSLATVFSMVTAVMPRIEVDITCQMAPNAAAQ